MSSGIERLERETYRSLFDDGLVDVCIGAFVLAIGVTQMTDVDMLPGVVGALLAPAWMVVRRFLIEPRAGSARLGARRLESLRQRILVLTLVLLLLMMLGNALWFARGGGLDAVPSGRVLLPIALGALLAVAGALFDFRRGIAYAVALPMARFAGDWAGLPRGWAMTAAGTVILVIGLVLLARFLRANPRLQPETGHVG